MGRVWWVKGQGQDPGVKRWGRAPWTQAQSARVPWRPSLEMFPTRQQKGPVGLLNWAVEVRPQGSALGGHLGSVTSLGTSARDLGPPHYSMSFCEWMNE